MQVVLCMYFTVFCDIFTVFSIPILGKKPYYLFFFCDSRQEEILLEILDYFDTLTPNYSSV